MRLVNDDLPLEESINEINLALHGSVQEKLTNKVIRKIAKTLELPANKTSLLEIKNRLDGAVCGYRGHPHYSKVLPLLVSLHQSSSRLLKAMESIYLQHDAGNILMSSHEISISPEIAANERLSRRANESYDRSSSGSLPRRISPNNDLIEGGNSVMKTTYELVNWLDEVTTLALEDVTRLKKGTGKNVSPEAQNLIEPLCHAYADLKKDDPFYFLTCGTLARVNPIAVSFVAMVFAALGIKLSERTIKESMMTYMQIKLDAIRLSGSMQV